MKSLREVTGRPVRVTVNDAFRGAMWWNAALIHLERFPSSTWPLIREKAAVTIPHLEWHRFVRVAQRLPGWGADGFPVTAKFLPT